MVWTSHPVATIRGAVRAPGDKSCSHRALIIAALAEGRSEVSGLLEGDDVLRTGQAVAALGAEVRQLGPGDWEIQGQGRFKSPSMALNFGNSGTGSRLMLGAMAGFDVEAEIVGDASLSARPMGRVLTPLRRMGVRADASEGDRLPLTFFGTSALRTIDYAPPQASAQVKSAILLAGLRAEGTTTVTEAKATRDHTERMLKSAGVALSTTSAGGGAKTVSISGGQPIRPFETAIPGDPSSAAFLAAAALINPNGEVLIERVMSNDTRSGFFDLIGGGRMGTMIGAEDAGEACGERLVDLQVTSSNLKGTAVPERLVPAMIDEFPILAVVASFAEGETLVTGAHELRVKETDRITAVVDLLRANGVNAEERKDGFLVEGCAGPPPGGGLVETRHDHRIAMAALVMGTAAQSPVRVDDIAMIATSYPGFLSDMAALGADIRDVPA